MKSGFKQIKTYTVRVWDIHVEEKFCGFKYEVKCDGKLIERDAHDSSHTRKPNTMRKILKSGYAAELALGCALGG